MSGLWLQIRRDAIDDLLRHAKLIHELMLCDAAGGHDLDGCNPLRVDTIVSLREVLDRAVLDKATMHRILAIVSNSSKPVLQLRHHTERPFSDDQGDDAVAPILLLRRRDSDDDDIPF